MSEKNRIFFQCPDHRFLEYQKNGAKTLVLEGAIFGTPRKPDTPQNGKKVPFLTLREGGGGGGETKKK